MRPEHLPYLADPVTKQPLNIFIERQEGPHVIAGELRSQSHAYPIIRGVPRLLPPTSPEHPSFAAHQQKTAESFAYEWNIVYQENDYEKQNFLHFLHPFVCEPDLSDKILLDAGCGSGRFTKQAALCGARLVIGSDLGRSVEAAFQLTRHLLNVCIVQADIYHMPVHQAADLTFSIGVLHHLPDPEGGFKQLPATVRPGGQLLIWVYNRRCNFRAVYVFETMRRLTRRLPRPLVYRLGYAPAAAVHTLNYATKALNHLGATRLAKQIPFSYYANFPFSMKVSDAFDVFATPHSNYYYVEEIEEWFRRAGLPDVRCFEHPEAGISCISLL